MASHVPLSWIRTGLMIAFGVILAGAAPAQDTSHPVISAYGAISLNEAAANPPDRALRYRVVFEISRAAADHAQINPGFERAARFVNLLGASGIHPEAGDIVIVIHGPATPSVMNDAAYEERFHQANPNTLVIEQLQQAGVAIHVCSYALANAKLKQQDVAENVVVDVAASITLSTLQLKGWVLLPG